MILGSVLAILCTVIVYVLGYELVGNRSSSNFGWAALGEIWRIFLRSILGIASAVVAGVGLVLSISSHNPATWAIYLSWLVVYSLGLTSYFYVRYGRKKATR